MDISSQYDKVYRYCYFKLGNSSIAEDITQETFLRCLDRGYDICGRDERIVYTIAKNLCIDEFRRGKHCQPLTENISAPDCENSTIDAIALQTALSKLDEDERELLLLRYVNNIPVSEIAGLLGISRFTVYRKCEKSFKKIRKIFKKEDLI